MVNSELLEEVIRLSGKKKGFLAQQIGLTRAGFRNCCVNKAEFKISQVKVLCHELHIDNDDMLKIFFAT